MIIEKPIRKCLKCTKFVDPVLLGLDWYYYCSNRNCARFGLLSVLFIWGGTAKSTEINA